MLIVTVFLDSAISPTRDKELARMHISNIGGSRETGLWNYDVRTYRGRSKEELDRRVITRQGKIDEVPSDDHHVWYLVGEALKAIEYDKRPGKGKRTKRFAE
jgi:hypothetical protein